MRLILAATAACTLLASAALAQPANQNGPMNAAVKPMDQNNSSTPVAGKNSFTMDQAKSAIEAKGYTNVVDLKLDKDGVWRATAAKAGRAMPVSLDYQGNVNN